MSDQRPAAHASLSDTIAPGLVVALIALSSLHKIFDTDVWWHIRTGEWIWQHGAILRQDPFSHVAQGPIAYTEWLTQLIFYGTYAAGGISGIIVLQAITATLLALALLRLIRSAAAHAPSGLTQALILLVWLSACHFRLGPKSDVFSFIGFALGLPLLVCAERDSSAKPLWAVLPLLLVWANLHRGATLMLGALVATVALMWLRPSSRAAARQATGVLVLAVVCVSLNPAGPEYMLDAFRLTSRSAFRTYLPEWGGLSVAKMWAIAPGLVLMFGLALVRAVARRALDGLTLIALGTTVLAFASARFIPFAGIALAPLASEGLELVLARSLDRIESAGASSAARTLLLALVLGVTGSKVVTGYPPATWGFGVLDWRLPVAAAEFLKAHPPPGKMWNSFSFGGYLIHALPGIKVSIDGRNDTVYSSTEFRRAMEAAYDGKVMKQLFDEQQIGFAVVECYRFRPRKYLALFQNPEWKLVYLDDVAAVFVRSSAESKAYLDRWAFRTLRPHDAIDRMNRFAADPERDALAADVQRLIQSHPSSIRALVLASLLYADRHELGPAQAAQSRALALADGRGMSLGAGRAEGP